jgi:hypothetical protein
MAEGDQEQYARLDIPSCMVVKIYSNKEGKTFLTLAGVGNESGNWGFTTSDARALSIKQGSIYAFRMLVSAAQFQRQGASFPDTSIIAHALEFTQKQLSLA